MVLPGQGANFTVTHPVIPALDLQHLSCYTGNIGGVVTPTYRTRHGLQKTVHVNVGPPCSH